MTKSNNWLQIDKDGFAKILAQRGKEFLLYELISNAWDEDITCVEATLTNPVKGYSTLIVEDNSKTGWKNLDDAYTLYAESYKKNVHNKRGRFNAGEKSVLALCKSATIESTTGTIEFSSDGTRKRTKKCLASGSRFEGLVRLTQSEFDEIVSKISYLIPPVTTRFNSKELPMRVPLKTFKITLPTVTSNAEGMLIHTSWKTEVRVYETLEGEIATLYEMGIPVVETGDKYHVDIQQKVPLNADRDNVTPSYLKTIRVAVLNEMNALLTEQDANELWVRQAASDSKCNPDSIVKVLDLRFGTNRVSFDPRDLGSNREAASKNVTVVHGGSMSSGEWDNARKANAIVSAGSMFPTNFDKEKVPNKIYRKDEWNLNMRMYALFVGAVSRRIIDRTVQLRYIEDKQIGICGSFDCTFGIMTVNLAYHDLTNPQDNYELLLHELAHDAVRSNDHLSHEFYEAVTKLGAKLTICAVVSPELFVP